MSDAIRKAVKAHTGKTGINGETLGVIIEKLTDLLSSHWEHIVDAANDPDAGNGTIKIGVALDLHVQHKTPKGNLTISFVPQRVKDECQFEVEDPDQTTLPLGGRIQRQSGDVPISTPVRARTRPPRPATSTP